MRAKDHNPTTNNYKLGRPERSRKAIINTYPFINDNWILLTYPLGDSNKTLRPLREAKLVARAEWKNSRHEGWWREGKKN